MRVRFVFVAVNRFFLAQRASAQVLLALIPPDNFSSDATFSSNCLVFFQNEFCSIQIETLQKF